MEKPVAPAYWLSPAGEIFDVNKTHIAFVISRPELFGLTREEIALAYAERGEKIGFEGKARKEIMKAALAKGWIRLRRYRNAGWRCELWEITPHASRALAAWAKSILELRDGLDEELELREIRYEGTERPPGDWIKKTSVAQMKRKPL